MKEALKLALEALCVAVEPIDCFAMHEQAITQIREALAQPEQEPVAWGVFEGNLHDMFFTQEEAQEMADLKGTHAEVRPFYTTPPAAQPAQEAIYGMNQDDWKDVVAAITKVRDGRGIYLACRPADVFQDWFLALGTAKVKDVLK